MKIKYMINRVIYFINRNLLEWLFVGLFLYIIFITAKVMENTDYIKNTFESTIDKMEIASSEKNMMNNKHALRSNPNLLVLNRADFQQAQNKLSKDIKKDLDDTCKYILDANSISFLFQMISILLLGIGVYLLKRINETRKQVMGYSDRMKDMSHANHLIQNCQKIYHFAMQLENEKKANRIKDEEHKKEMRKIIFDKNMLNIHFIDIEIDRFFEYVENNHIFALNDGDDRNWLSKLSNDAKQLFLENDLDLNLDICKNTLRKLDQLIKKIEKFEIMDNQNIKVVIEKIPVM